MTEDRKQMTEDQGQTVSVFRHLFADTRNLTPDTSTLVIVIWIF